MPPRLATRVARRLYAWRRRRRIARNRRVLRLLLGELDRSVKPIGMPRLTFPERIRIGPRTTINNGVIIGGRGGVSIGEHVRISNLVIIESGFLDPYTVPRSEHGSAPIVIEDGVHLGAGSTVLAGVRVGMHSVVAAGAVVARDVPPYSIARGVPATVEPIKGIGDAPADPPTSRDERGAPAG